MSSPDIVLKGDTTQSLGVLKELADFWKIPYSTSGPTGEGSLVFQSLTGRTEVEKAGTTVISPHEDNGFKHIVSEFGLHMVRRNVEVRIPVALGIFTSLRSEIALFSGEALQTVIDVDGVPILSKIDGSNVYVLPLDIVSKYSQLLEKGISDTPSLKFRLATRLPFSYNTIPSFIRERAFRSREQSKVGFEQRLGPVECLRALFLACLARVSRTPIPRIGFWRRGKTYALSITHDIETRAGLLSGCSELISVEKKLGLRSTWDLPSERYTVESSQLARLTESGEVCGHDTAHDGRLVLLSPSGMARRMARCKELLELKTGREVLGFRSPLLQHSRDLIAAVGKAGFKFDSSTPSWEYLSPTSLRPHGVGTVFPFFVDGVLEIPVSLPQDHQLIRVAGMNPREAVDTLLEIAGWMRGVGGACVLLVHPDYEFGLPENAHEYERLLQFFQSDSQCDIMTLSELAEWWSLRSRASIDPSGKVMLPGAEAGPRTAKDFEVQIVKGHGAEGFDVETVS